MHAAFVLAFAALAAAAPRPQGVSSAITPESTAPAGCSGDYDGTFQIQVVNVTTSKRSLYSRQSEDCEGSECQSSDDLTMTLSGGTLVDDEGRTGYIASNSQFQFDSPPQAGAIYTAGWSVCSNNSLAIGNDAVFYQCLSGTFYNLYDEGELGDDVCSPVYIQVVGGGAPVPAPEPSSAPATSAPATSAPATSAPATSAPATSAPAVTSAPAPTVAPTGTGVAPSSSSYTGPAIATGAAAPTGVPKMVGLAGAALAAVAML